MAEKENGKGEEKGGVFILWKFERGRSYSLNFCSLDD
jgi:hypothetical protein